MRVGLEECEIRSFLADRGSITKVFVTAEPAAGGPLYRIYIWSSWSRHFRPLRSWGDRSDRVYRDLGRAVVRMRDLGYRGAVTFYEADDPVLSRYHGLVASERPKRPPG